MNTWEDKGKGMADDYAQRIRMAQALASAQKAKIAKERGLQPNDRAMLFALLKRQPDEGKIIRAAEGCCCEIFYDEAALSNIAEETPWILPDLLRELNGGDR